MSSIFGARLAGVLLAFSADRGFVARALEAMRAIWFGPMLVNVETDALFAAARHWEGVAECSVTQFGPLAIGSTARTAHTGGGLFANCRCRTAACLFPMREGRRMPFMLAESRRIRLCRGLSQLF